MKKSLFKKEFEKYEGLMQSLNVLKSEIENTSADETLLAARKAKVEASRQYTKTLYKVTLNDREYLALQTEIVRKAALNFSHEHNCKGFFNWFEDNEKDQQTRIIDTTQRLLSHVTDLYKEYQAGATTAKAKAKAKLSKAEQIAALKAQLAALEAEE
jgi:hypothetical protein